METPGNCQVCPCAQNKYQQCFTFSAPEKIRCLKNNSYQGSKKSKTKKKCHTVEQFQYPIVEREVNLIPVIHKCMTVHISGLTQALQLTVASQTCLIYPHLSSQGNDAVLVINTEFRVIQKLCLKMHCQYFKSAQYSGFRNGCDFGYSGRVIGSCFNSVLLALLHITSINKHK